MSEPGKRTFEAAAPAFCPSIGTGSVTCIRVLRVSVYQVNAHSKLLPRPSALPNEFCSVGTKLCSALCPLCPCTAAIHASLCGVVAALEASSTYPAGYTLHAVPVVRLVPLVPAVWSAAVGAPSAARVQHWELPACTLQSTPFMRFPWCAPGVGCVECSAGRFQHVPCSVHPFMRFPWCALCRLCGVQRVGGFSKYPAGHPDILHSFYGVCGLSLAGFPGLKPIYGPLGICLAAAKEEFPSVKAL